MQSFTMFTLDFVLFCVCLWVTSYLLLLSTANWCNEGEVVPTVTFHHIPAFVLGPVVVALILACLVVAVIVVILAVLLLLAALICGFIPAEDALSLGDVTFNNHYWPRK